MSSQLVKINPLELARRSPAGFAEYASDGEWLIARHLAYLNMKLMQLARRDRRKLMVFMPPRHGKLLRDSTPVPTPYNGLRKHSELRPGDYVYSPNGEPTRVLSVTRDYKWPLMRVSFSDGTHLDASPEHEWVVETDRDCRKKACSHLSRGHRHTEQLETQQLLAGYHRRAPSILLARPLTGCERSLPIDPYVLGLWLGDGTSASGDITLHVDDAPEQSHLGTLIGYKDRDDVFILRIPGLAKLLLDNNLKRNKHVPTRYLCASVAQRQALLQGLMDSDGYASKEGQLEFCNTNRQLAEGVYQLVCSLGMKASWSEQRAKLYGVDHGERYRVGFYANPDLPVFRLQRKLNRCNTSTGPTVNQRYITDVEPIGQGIGQCIQVEGGSYLAGEQCVPTHNSELVSKYLPAWIVGYLRQKVMLVSYEAKFAGEWGTKSLNLLLEHGEKVFGAHVRRKDASREHWETDEGGVMYTSGVGGAQTGKGCHWLIIDDPIKNAEQARSSAERRNIDDWYRSTASTRVEPNGVTILMMTRWHEEDLAGTLLADEPDDWDVVRFPAIAMEDDILGRLEGEALWPERWPEEELLKKQHTLEADYNWWEAMYQQDPSSPEGNKVKLEWFNEYEDLPTEFEDIIITWDAASKTADHNAFSCAAVWGVTENGYYVIDVRRGRVEFPDLVDWANAYGDRFPEAMNVIEDTSNGTPLIQTLQRQTRLNVYPQSVHQDKSARLSAVLNIIKGGNVYLPKNASWLRDFKEEHRKFPSTTFKDQVDTTSLALAYLGKRESRFPEHTRSVQAPQRDNSIYYDDFGGSILRVPGLGDV